MGGWREVRLGDVCEKIGSGATPRGGRDAYSSSGISLIRSQNVLDFMCSDNGLAYINPSQADRLKNVCVKENDVLLNITGDSVARSCKVDASILPARVNQHVAIIRGKSNIISNSFILYYFQMKKPYLLMLSAGGATRKALTKQMIEDLLIYLPDIDEQNKIVKLLDEIQEKIANNTAINKNLEEQALAVFKAWFIDLIPWNRQKPKSWSEGTLGHFVKIKRGGSPRPIQNFLTETGFRWLKISDVTSLQSPFVIEIKEHIKEDGLNKTVHLCAGSLVLSNSATPGIPKILDVDSCIHDGWLYFPESKLSNEFLYLFFKHIRNDLVKLGNGSVFTNLKTDILKKYSFSIPDKETLSRFDDFIKPYFSLLNNIARENHRLTALRNTLLPYLMSGEIDVSKIDI